MAPDTNSLSSASPRVDTRIAEALTFDDVLVVPRFLRCAADRGGHHDPVYPARSG